MSVVWEEVSGDGVRVETQLRRHRIPQQAVPHQECMRETNDLIYTANTDHCSTD